MRLEQQITALADLGINLSDAVSIDDMLYSCGREDYESRPFGIILFVMGVEAEREPMGRYMSNNSWSLDTESIHSSGDYVDILGNLCRIARHPARLTEISDHVDLNTGEGWIEYTCDGIKHRRTIKIDEDWVDMVTLSSVMRDIENSGHYFYCMGNGQGLMLYYLDKASATRLGKLAVDEITRAVPA